MCRTFLRPNFLLSRETNLSSFVASVVRTEFRLASIASTNEELLIAPSLYAAAMGQVRNQYVFARCHLPPRVPTASAWTQKQALLKHRRGNSGWAVSRPERDGLAVCIQLCGCDFRL